jgi:hypothetical protein
VQGVTYVVGIAGAYNAFGLIGPEHNGVFILDDTHKRVLTDRICEESTGYFGPSKRQWDELARTMRMGPAEFEGYIVNSPRYRGAA